MVQLIPGLAALVEAFREGFHPQVFPTFQALIAGWIVCLGLRTISEVWQATGLATKRHHDTAYAVFHSAAWEWDDLGLVLAPLILKLGGVVSGGVAGVAADGASQQCGGVYEQRSTDAPFAAPDGEPRPARPEAFVLELP